MNKTAQRVCVYCAPVDAGRLAQRVRDRALHHPAARQRQRAVETRTRSSITPGYVWDW
jgi:hypothetical protein